MMNSTCRKDCLPRYVTVIKLSDEKLTINLTAEARKGFRKGRKGKVSGETLIRLDRRIC